MFSHSSVFFRHFSIQVPPRSQERIIQSFEADSCCRPVSGKHVRIIRQAEQPALYSVYQVRIAAVLKICSADRPLKECIAGEDNLLVRHIEAAPAGSMSGGGQDAEPERAQCDLLLILYKTCHIISHHAILYAGKHGGHLACFLRKEQISLHGHGFNMIPVMQIAIAHLMVKMKVGTEDTQQPEVITIDKVAQTTAFFLPHTARIYHHAYMLVRLIEHVGIFHQRIEDKMAYLHILVDWPVGGLSHRQVYELFCLKKFF